MVAPRPLIHQVRVYDPAFLASVATTEDADTKSQQEIQARLKGKYAAGKAGTGTKGTTPQCSQTCQSRECPKMRKPPVPLVCLRVRSSLLTISSGMSS